MLSVALSLSLLAISAGVAATLALSFASVLPRIGALRAAATGVAGSRTFDVQMIEVRRYSDHLAGGTVVRLAGRTQPAAAISQRTALRAAA